MARAIVIQHVAMEGPARIAGLCAERDISVEVRHVHAGDAVPAELGRDEILVVMGGGMGVGDLGDPRYPFLQAEVTLLERVLADGGAVLGVCLGAQLLAHAAGARVYPNVARDAGGREHRVLEVGWGPVTYLLGGQGGAAATQRGEDAADDPALAGLARQEMVLHWHGDTFDLPPRAVHLASTALCAHQAFRLGTRVFGLQFHLEADAEVARRWAVEDAAFVRAARGADGVALVLAETERHAAAARAAGDRLIRNILDSMLRPRQSRLHGGAGPA
ncbi:MAG: amidotransferase [Polyangia bacterium]